MKFSQLTLAAALALSTGLASAAPLPSIGSASTSFVIADNVTLTGSAQLFEFDALDGPLSITLTSETDGSVTDFALFDSVDLTTPLTFSAPVVSPDSVTFTYSGLTFGTYVVSLTGSGTASIYGSVNTAAPVPEPETYGLALAGLLVAGAVLRRRGQAA